MRGLPRLPYSRAVVTETHLLIALVDDEEPVRKALMRLMRSAGLTVVTFGSGAEFLNSLETRLPDCVVLDLHMPHMDGFNVQAHLARKCAALPVIIVTGHGDVSKSVQAMKQGAFDFLSKPVKDKDLLTAVRAAIERDTVARRERAKLSEIRARLDTLTPREREVLEHVVSGKLNKQIAGDLGITEATVKMHRARVMAKMKVPSVAELARLTERCGTRGNGQ